MSAFITDGNGTLSGVILYDDASLLEETVDYTGVLLQLNKQTTLGAVQQDPVVQAAQLLSTLSDDSVVYIYDYPFESLNPYQESSVSYTITPSGQVVFSGAAPITFVGPATYTLSASGIFVLSGAVEELRTRAQSVSGGVVLSGSTPALRTKVEGVSGGVVFSGSPTQLHTRLENVSGQVVFSGAATISFVSGGGGSGSIPRRTLVGTGV